MLKGKYLDLKSAGAMLPERAEDSHKGSFGKVLLICGSRCFIGCCSLATEGALRSGAGLVTLAFPEGLYAPLASRLTENLFLPLPEENGFISESSIPLLLKKAGECDAVLVGCGIGVNNDTIAVVKALVENVRAPLILDADALNCLCYFKTSLLTRRGKTLLTPHPGEMARLMDTDVKSVEADRQKAAMDFSSEFRVNVLLKGHRTVISNDCGSELYVNKTGNSGLAKGGSGDLLSGIIAGIAPSLNGDLFKAAVLGAFIHGLSADLLKGDCSEFSMLPSDCAANLKKVFKLLEEST